MNILANKKFFFFYNIKNIRFIEIYDQKHYTL